MSRLHHSHRRSALLHHRSDRVCHSLVHSRCNLRRWSRDSLGRRLCRRNRILAGGDWCSPAHYGRKWVVLRRTCLLQIRDHMRGADQDTQVLRRLLLRLCRCGSVSHLRVRGMPASRFDVLLNLTVKIGQALRDRFDSTPRLQAAVHHFPVHIPHQISVILLLFPCESWIGLGRWLLGRRLLSIFQVRRRACRMDKDTEFGGALQDTRDIVFT
mmetsp:Transcript_24075/g.58514  ORF Transcript_24075/g.58514 Transcript_24075/m.58514 type:complete len:213 (+) Transcript_24075:217-855(+)